MKNSIIAQSDSQTSLPRLSVGNGNPVGDGATPALALIARTPAAEGRLDGLARRIAVNDANTPGDAHAIYKITRPGSYFLRGNVVGESGKAGVEIAASHVTLDLMGFELVGVSGARDGIRVSTSAPANIVIRNGGVRNWEGDGVEAALAVNGRLENMLASHNRGAGLRVGRGWTVSNCTTYYNGGCGLNVGDGAVIMACAARDNGEDGIFAAIGCVLTHCVAADNGACGVQTAGGSSVTYVAVTGNRGSGVRAMAAAVAHCTALRNGRDGIEAVHDCYVSYNTSTHNGAGGDGAGLRAGGRGNRFESNHVNHNPCGIVVEAAGNLIVRNSAAGNAKAYEIAKGNLAGLVIGGKKFDSCENPNANFEF